MRVYGFHSGYAPKSVRTYRTVSAGASISTEVWMSLIPALHRRPRRSIQRDTYEHPSRPRSAWVSTRGTLLTVLAHTAGMPTDPRNGRSAVQPTVRTGLGFFFGVA
jgi:hypothetical protein